MCVSVLCRLCCVVCVSSVCRLSVCMCLRVFVCLSVCLSVCAVSSVCRLCVVCACSGSPLVLSALPRWRRAALMQSDRGHWSVWLSRVRSLPPTEGKGEDGLAQQAREHAVEAQRDRFEGTPRSETANPLSAIAKATGSRAADAAAPLYFPGARSAALRDHAGVKFLVFRVDSPENLSDPIPIIFKLSLDLSRPTLRTSNPAHTSQKLSRKYYALKDVDVDLWDHDGKFGISLVERKTKCFCLHSGIERDYVFADEHDRDRFCCLIYAVDDGVLPPGAVDGVAKEASVAADVRPIQLFVSTWNQGDTEPASNIGQDWIPTSGAVDMFVIGTQESPIANALGVSAGTAASTKWFKILEDTVGDDYVTVATRSMYQNHLWVSTKREHAAKITNVETYQAEQGLGKIWGNKGGTAVALRFNGHRLAFVNTHLAAHAEKWERRNTDIGNIVQEVHFGIYNQVEFHTQYTTFWLGDMNYRVEMDRVEAAAVCDAGQCEELFAHEQLKREMAKGLLDGFVEGELTFRPTYKLDPLVCHLLRCAAPPMMRTLLVVQPRYFLTLSTLLLALPSPRLCHLFEACSCGLGSRLMRKWCPSRENFLTTRTGAPHGQVCAFRMHLRCFKF